MPPLNGSLGFNQAIPTNDVTQPNYPITLLNQGNHYLTLTADPTNPNIVYLGSFGGTSTDLYAGSDTGLIRIDTTKIWDAHSLVAPLLLLQRRRRDQLCTRLVQRRFNHHLLHDRSGMSRFRHQPDCVHLQPRLRT